MISYLIIDDEPIAHRIIEGYCNNIPQLHKTGNCYNAFEAMQMLNQQQTDLIFLDINMPRLSGFDFIKTLPDPPNIIVTTAYKEYALEGFELNVIDYLLKPFSFERFMKALNKVRITKQANVRVPSEMNTEKPARIFLKGDKRYYQVNINEILFVEAYGNYSKIHLLDEMILCHEKISSLEKILPDKKFLRVHKSFLISLNHIEVIEGNRIYIKNHIVPVGQTYKLIVNNLIKN
ncbi:LytTR family DNA-binding domain-containing protein [Zhouia spongiae]|uniref:LytTR family DNA-binding domain-containing protein n=1 Tax=Zhouia spongiae TaxID=2202721 RepID=A0ABY3YJL0_9FLAO|nr:LytTR family DNA-binding domain-containing protein [Zhouia spongiae]UNY98041.1 LytTR family DNA-binding domain-containing protein [Zhouia spongiae]